MAPVNLKSLVGRLNGASRRALEAAAGLCLSRTHYNVEIEHWLLKLLDDSGGDLAAILHAFEVDEAHWLRTAPQTDATLANDAGPAPRRPRKNAARRRGKRAAAVIESKVDSMVR